MHATYPNRAGFSGPRTTLAAAVIALVGAVCLAGCTDGDAEQLVQQPQWCEDALAIYVRGSGEELGSAGAATFRETVEESVPGVHVVELGEKAWSPGLARYPATKIERNVEPTSDNVFTAQFAQDYFESVDRGTEELASLIAASAASCPQTPVAVMGYSQGAQIVGEALSILGAFSPETLDSVAYAALLGDPALSLAEGGETTESASACRGDELSTYRAYVPTCTAYQGLLGARTPYVPHQVATRVGTWCQEADPVCGAGRKLLDWDPHFTYLDDPNFYADASQRIVTALRGDDFKPTIRFPLGTYYASPEQQINLRIEGLEPDDEPLWVLAGHAYEPESSSPSISFDEFFADYVVATVGSEAAEAAIVVDGLRAAPLGPPPPASVSASLEKSKDSDLASARVTWERPSSPVLAYAVWVDHYPVGAVLGNVHDVQITDLDPTVAHTISVSSLRIDSTSSPLTTTELNPATTRRN